MSKTRHRFSLPQRARALAPASMLPAAPSKLGVAAPAAKQARPAPLCHSAARYYNAAGELIAAPIASKAAR